MRGFVKKIYDTVKGKKKKQWNLLKDLFANCFT
jgi:hypothetical protein